MRDIETNMVRLATGGQCGDFDLMFICLRHGSKTITELRDKLSDVQRADTLHCEDYIPIDTQYVELVALETATRLTSEGLIDAIDALPHSVHTIVLNGKALRDFCKNRCSQLNSQFFSQSKEEYLITQATQLIEGFARRIEFSDTSDFNKKVQQRLDDRKQQTFKAVSAIADYASESSKGIEDVNVGRIIMTYRDF